MTKWNDFLLKGLHIEKEFAYLLTKWIGGIVTKSTKEQDCKDHIDLIWQWNEKDYYFDVKGMKKTNRKDNDFNNDIHWIELRNVNGKEGWLFGKAHYIAFETKDDFLIIKRKKLIQFINEKVIDKNVYSTKGLYTFYQRAGRSDVITQVLTKDLYAIADRILEKVKD